MKCGLLGRKLGHSYSPAIHAQLGDYEYHLYEKEPEELEAFLLCGDWDGINVTIPYKTAVLPYLDIMTPIATQLCAVNTIIRRNGKLIGTNTDHFGFTTLLQQSGLSPTGKKCLVLGSGGASKVVEAVLRQHDAEVIVISRQGEHNYTNLHLHQDCAIIINATPVGMYPHNGNTPVDLGLFPHLEGVLDLVYNPARTKLLIDAAQRDLVAMNGLSMLVAQAKEASEWFTETAISNDKIGQIQSAMESQMENIVLIGMPGCGKSTIGALLAQKTGRTFVQDHILQWERCSSILCRSRCGNIVVLPTRRHRKNEQPCKNRRSGIGRRYQSSSTDRCSNERNSQKRIDCCCDFFQSRGVCHSKSYRCKHSCRGRFQKGNRLK